ncbi:hypothetical protein [Micromonospora lupini]|uniref:Secreted protein n=1 Tax=Micromonospora lupini str. Lupac 08 TaxID=1150864 RepID=I0L6Q4_9ACTN|nr:hypothetical protein [Micromonospora lupini]CCH19501.1 Exported hypothetical protein [Micromonospora lupini str. Lupac 08]
MIRTLVVASLLLLTGCSPAEAPSPAPSSTTPSDKAAAAACTRVVRSIEAKDSPIGDVTTAMASIDSTDPAVREAGQRLGSAAKEAGDLWVKNDPTVDTGPANQRLADARQGMLTACTNLFGEYPWPFTRKPAPTPSR